MIYFIQCEENGPIKVGQSDDPKERLRQLQTSNPYELKLIWVYNGDGWTEKMIHKKLENLHIRGEWYHPSETIFMLMRRHLSNEHTVKLNFENEVFIYEGSDNNISIFYNHGVLDLDIDIYDNKIQISSCGKIIYNEVV